MDKPFIYHLGSSTNVAKIKSALEQKEVIDTMETVQFSDPLYKIWFQQFMVNS